jgi:acyl phosphate:glycerol-3-phosphate acyltransferase
MAIVAAAPVAGHAFSPFLAWRGGKAVAATFGTWAGLTVWEGPTVLGLSLLVTTRFLRSAWAVMAAMLALLAWFVFSPSSWNGLGVRPPLSVTVPAWILNMLVLIWKHRADLTFPIHTARPSSAL